MSLGVPIGDGPRTSSTPARRSAADRRAAWLECPTFAAPILLPAAASRILRDLGHDRSRIIELPATEGAATDHRLTGTGSAVATRA